MDPGELCPNFGYEEPRIDCCSCGVDACMVLDMNSQRGKEVRLDMADARPVLKDVEGSCCNYCSIAVKGMGYLVAHELESDPSSVDIARAAREQLVGFRLDVVSIEVDVPAGCEESVHGNLCRYSMRGCCCGHHLKREAQT